MLLPLTPTAFSDAYNSLINTDNFNPPPRFRFLAHQVATTLAAARRAALQAALDARHRPSSVKLAACARPGAASRTVAPLSPAELRVLGYYTGRELLAMQLGCSADDVAEFIKSGGADGPLSPADFAHLGSVAAGPTPQELEEIRALLAAAEKQQQQAAASSASAAAAGGGSAAGAAAGGGGGAGAGQALQKGKGLQESRQER